MKSSDFSERFNELKSELNKNYCEGCPFRRQGDVIDLLIELFTESINALDKSAQTMEDHIALFNEIEEALFKEKMKGGSDL